MKRLLIVISAFCFAACSSIDLTLQAAKKASPPVEQGEFLPSELLELSVLDASFKFDVRYASDNNFLNTKVYPSTRMLLQRPAAQALLRAAQQLKKQGYGVLIHDAYRPWFITKLMWDVTPVAKRDFVADPSKGSRHNRGCAIDLSLYDLRTGEPVSMPSGYDEFSERASPNYQGGTDEQRAHRDHLRAAMEAEGFSVYDQEWWHFDFKDWRRYAIQNVDAEKIQ